MQQKMGNSLPKALRVLFYHPMGAEDELVALFGFATVVVRGLSAELGEFLGILSWQGLGEPLEFPTQAHPSCKEWEI